MSNGPNPLRAAWHMLWARRVRSPHPAGTSGIDHSLLVPVLEQLRSEGIGSLADSSRHITGYREHLETVDPDTLSHQAALAYWMNLYNAGALQRAGDALSNDHTSVLRLPGAFSSPWATVAGETMSLDDIEHGKIRRFGDPRIHGALVCGSVSCPTLRGEPFTGDELNVQLDDQMRSFLAGGGARLDRASDTLHLTRVLKWYGSDFVRPNRMPTLVPASGKRTAMAIRPWLESADAEYVGISDIAVKFASYDWGLGCSIA